MSVIKFREGNQSAVGMYAGGGNIVVKNGATPTLRMGGWGVGFGPLRIAPFDATTVVIDELGFEALDRFSLPFLNTAAGVPLTETAAAGAGLSLVSSQDDETDDQASLTRRDALIAATAFATTMASTGVASAQNTTDDGDTEETTANNVATFKLEDSPRGIQIGIDDMVAEYLPADSEYYVEIDGSTQGSFTAGGDSGAGSLTTGPGLTGEVRVISEDGVAFWKRVLANISGNEPLVYTFRTDEPVSEYSRDEEIIISDQNLVVDAIESAGPKGTILRVGGEAVDHIDEGSDEYGNWYLRDNVTLVYRVGVNSPKATDIELTINADRLETIEADLLG